MAYPITLAPFLWQDLPSEATPFDKEKAQAAEARLIAFTEHFELHWRAPVAKIGGLPVEALAGDVALVEELAELFYYNGSEWKAVTVAIAEKHAHTIESHTWAVAGEVTKTDIPGPFVLVAANETQVVVKLEYETVKGKVKFSLLHNGAKVKGIEKLEANTTKAKEATPEVALTLASGDYLTLEIESVEETPEGFALTAFVEHVAKAV